MESENMKIELFASDEQTPVVPVARLTVKGVEMVLSIDELRELNKIVECSWSANDLYSHTSEAIAERQRWENERTCEGSISNGANPLRLRRVGQFN